MREERGEGKLDHGKAGNMKFIGSLQGSGDEDWERERVTNREKER